MIVECMSISLVYFTVHGHRFGIVVFILNIYISSYTSIAAGITSLLYDTTLLC